MTQLIYAQCVIFRIAGMFTFRTPFYLIRCPSIMKLFCVNHFDSFTDHMSSMTPELDPLLGNALISLQGKKWKDMRGTLSPAFTGITSNSENSNFLMDFN